jgi:group I intron endonuclease
MYGIIYKATGPTGRVYIGKTTETLAQRKSKHAYRAKKGDRRDAFHIALIDEGFNNFQWDEIDSADSKESLDAKEKFWIAHYKADNSQFGYNTLEGGSNPKHTPETKRKISEAKKGKPVSENERHRLAEMSRNISPEARKKISAANTGKRRSTETRRKNSEAHKGINTWMKGRKLPEETRRKISETQKGKQNIGEKNGRAKITEAIARNIKIDLQAGMMTCDLAKKYNTSVEVVRAIKCGKSWAWLQIEAMA